MIEGIFVEGLFYGIMVLGVFITFRVMDFPDLTVEGSFPFGAALMAAMLTMNVSPWLALLVAFAGGILAGCITAAIHNYLKVPNLLAGIITSTMLYSINIRTMFDRANLNLLKTDSIIGQAVNFFEKLGIPREWGMLVFFIIVVIVVKLLIDLFFRTDLGLTMGAMGNNPQVVISAGVDPRVMKFIGLGLSNGLVALSGALACEYMGFADASLGLGILVSGLASVLLGEFLSRLTQFLLAFPKKILARSQKSPAAFRTLSSLPSRISFITLHIILGSLMFRAIMYGARVFGFDLGLKPSDNRLLTGLMIIVVLAIPLLQKYTHGRKAGPAVLAKEAPRA